MNWIEVPTTNKKGDSTDYQLVNLDNALYIREWVQNRNAPMTENNKGQTVIYVVGGKEVIVDLPIQEVYVLFIEKGYEIRDTKVLTRTEEGDKVEAE